MTDENSKKPQSRSSNIHETRRIKKKRSKYYNAVSECDNEEQRHRRAGIVSRTPKTCNCWMCSNQRKIHGPNFNEIRGLYKSDLELDSTTFCDVNYEQDDGPLSDEQLNCIRDLVNSKTLSSEFQNKLF